MTDGLRGTVEGAQSALARSIARANLAGDPLGQALDAMSQSLGAQLELHERTTSHYRDVNHRLDMAVADAILRATTELDERRESVVQRLAPELANMTAQSVARWNRSVSARTALTVGGFAVALALAFGACGYGTGWKAGRETAVADAGALAETSRQAGSQSTDTLVAMVRSNDLAEAWSKCKASATLDKSSGRRVCLMPMWVDAPRQPAPG